MDICLLINEAYVDWWKTEVYTIRKSVCAEFERNKGRFKFHSTFPVCRFTFLKLNDYVISTLTAVRSSESLYSQIRKVRFQNYFKKMLSQAFRTLSAVDLYSQIR